MNEENKVADIISKLNETEELLKIKNISAIEKDILLEKLRRMYETVIIKNTIISQQPFNHSKIEKIATEKIIPKEEKLPNPIKEEEVIFDKIEDKVVESFTNTYNDNKFPAEKEIEINDKEKTEPIVSESLIRPIKENKEETLIEKEEIKNSSQTLAEKYRINTVKTISDTMIKSEKDLSTKIQLKPIKSIKSAISINDRIMFTRELFENNTEHYNQVIDKVNNMNDLNEAFEYLATQIKIHEQSEPIQKFLEIVNRRFIKA